MKKAPTYFKTLKDALRWIEKNDLNSVHEYHLIYKCSTKEEPEWWNLKRKLHNPSICDLEWNDV